MKLLAILLLASSVTVAQSFIKSCGGIVNPPRSEWSTLSRADYVNNLNYDRKVLMEEVGISNMFELKYDPSLEDEIRKMNSCDDLNHGPNYRVENRRDAEASMIIAKVVAKMKSRQKVGEEAKLFPEQYHPGQTFVAWCDLKRACSAEYWGRKIEYGYIKRVYVFGPKSTYSDSDFKYGTPGADCPNGVVPKSDKKDCTYNCGLCKGPEIPSKDVATENSIDADSAAPCVGVVLILAISFMMYFS